MFLDSVFGIEGPTPATNGSVTIYANKLGIQQGYSGTGQTNWILLTATSGILNSTSNILVMTKTGPGHFTFTSLEPFNLQLTFDFSRVELEGDQGNDIRLVENGDINPVSAGNTVTVYWNLILEPFLPYMFILGMIGLGAMFGGPILAIKMMKENPKWALTQGVIFTTLGFGLFIAWLGSP